jgi:hypothetical protein
VDFGFRSKGTLDLFIGVRIPASQFQGNINSQRRRALSGLFLRALNPRGRDISCEQQYNAHHREKGGKSNAS